MNEVGNFWDILKSSSHSSATVQNHLPKMILTSCARTGTAIRVQIEDLLKKKQSMPGNYFWRPLKEWTPSLHSDGSVAVSFQDLLSFMTGADETPPCGFSKSIEVHFYTDAEGETRLPHVSTCSLDLWLPRGEEPRRFFTLLLRSLLESQGFLKV